MHVKPYAESFPGRNPIKSAALGLILFGMSSTQAALFSFHSFLNGAQTVPPNASPGWGSATGLYDTVTGEYGLGGLVEV